MTNESPPPDPAAPESAAPPSAVAPEAPPERPASDGGSFERRDDRGGRGDRRDRDDDSDDRPRRGGGGFRRRGCEFCIGHTNVLDYKDTERVRRYIGERGKMEARRKVGTCAKHQRVVARAVKRARYMAMLPYTSEHIRITGVPGGGGRR